MAAGWWSGFRANQHQLPAGMASACRLAAWLGRRQGQVSVLGRLLQITGQRSGFIGGLALSCVLNLEAVGGLTSLKEGCNHD